jgi:hypothetical protein
VKVDSGRGGSYAWAALISVSGGLVPGAETDENYFKATLN